MWRRGWTLKMASDYDQRISYSEKISLNESIEIKLYTTEIFLIVKINIYLFFTRYIYIYISYFIQKKSSSF